MEVEIKSTAVLLDELIILNIRIWNMIDFITLNKDTRIAEVANYAITVQELNARRTALIRAIDGRLGEESNTLAEKTYGNSG